MAGNNEQIDYQYKLLYMLAICFVVAGHCDNGGISIFYDWFPPYGFHLGLFMFCSGYFYKYKKQESFVLFLLKKAKRLLVPLFLWNIVYAFFVWITHNYGFTIGGSVNFDNLIIKPITNGHQFAYNMGGWFVIPLFMVQSVNWVLDRYLFFIKQKDHKIELFIFFIYMILGTLAVHYASLGYNKEWYLVIVRMGVFMPFFAAGRVYKTLLKKHDKLSSVVYFFVIFLLQLSIISKNVTCTWCLRMPCFSRIGHDNVAILDFQKPFL